MAHESQKNIFDLKFANKTLNPLKYRVWIFASSRPTL